MARTREQHDADIRAQTPEIVVSDGARRSVFRRGDPEYETTVARWVDEHVAADARIEADERERTNLAILLPLWEQGTPEQRALAWLLRRAGIAPANGAARRG